MLNFREPKKREEEQERREGYFRGAKQSMVIEFKLVIIGCTRIFNHYIGKN